MEKIRLKAVDRVAYGKTKAKALRSQGLVPVVCYKEGKPASSYTVNAKELYHALHTKAGINVLIHLDIKDKKTAKTVVIQELQRDPLKNEVMHVDFHEISMKDVIKMHVPVVAHGEAKEVQTQGGMVDHLLWELEVECQPTAIPQKISVEISELKIGEAIYVKDIPAIEGVKIFNDPEAIVFAAKAAKIVVEEEVAEDEASEEPEIITKGKKEEIGEVPAKQGENQ